jgi:YidC/Oxa1 family membrane protein insertase
MIWYFKKYRETVDPRSENIRLFSPSGSQNPYYAEFGWIAAAPSSIKVPDSNTVWSAAQSKLTPDAPLVLTYDNQEGVVFTRTIRVDAQAMFTVEDSVLKASGDPVSLFPYGLVSRHGKPVVEGFLYPA